MTPRRRGSRVGFTAGEKRAMAELYRAGVSVRQVATRFGITYNAAHYHLRRAGVTFRPCTGGPGWRAEATA
jgi:transposase-like protein